MAIGKVKTSGHEPLHRVTWEVTSSYCLGQEDDSPSDDELKTLVNKATDLSKFRKTDNKVLVNSLEMPSGLRLWAFKLNEAQRAELDELLERTSSEYWRKLKCTTLSQHADFYCEQLVNWNGLCKSNDDEHVVLLSEVVRLTSDELHAERGDFLLEVCGRFKNVLHVIDKGYFVVRVKAVDLAQENWSDYEAFEKRRAPIYLFQRGGHTFGMFRRDVFERSIIGTNTEEITGRVDECEAHMSGLTVRHQIRDEVDPYNIVDYYVYEGREPFADRVRNGIDLQHSHRSHDPVVVQMREGYGSEAVVVCDPCHLKYPKGLLGELEIVDGDLDDLEFADVSDLGIGEVVRVVVHDSPYFIMPRYFEEGTNFWNKSGSAWPRLAARLPITVMMVINKEARGAVRGPHSEDEELMICTRSSAFVRNATTGYMHRELSRGPVLVSQQGPYDLIIEHPNDVVGFVPEPDFEEYEDFDRSQLEGAPVGSEKIRGFDVHDGMLLYGNKPLIQIEDRRMRLVSGILSRGDKVRRPDGYIRDKRTGNKVPYYDVARHELPEGAWDEYSITDIGVFKDGFWRA